MIYSQCNLTHILLKAVNDCTEQFGFLYNAQYPETSKKAIENAILKRKTLNNELEPAVNDINLCEMSGFLKIKSVGFFDLLVFNRTGKLPILIQSFCQVVNGTIF